jgi:Peptidase A4 family
VANATTEPRALTPGILCAMTRRSRLVGFGVVALLLLFLAIKIVPARSGGKIADGFSDAPFGPFAGYAWIGSVHSAGGSFTVPRIASGSPLSQAATWIGVQGGGPPARFVQIGEIESRFWSSQKQKTVDVYFTVWSDTAHRYKPQPLFPVSPGDTLTASLTLANKQWTLAITDDTSRKKARFSIGAETDGPFNQAGRENDHARYPQMASPLFQDLTVNSAKPSRAALYSQWMSVNHSNLAPTTPHDDSFTLERAPAVSAAAALYLRLFTAAGSAFDKFETERTNWNAKMPYEQIATASSQFITATQNGIRSLLAARWSKQIRSLVRSFAHMTSIRVAHARPPTLLTAASFAVWNSRLTEASMRAGPAGAKLRLALGLPAFGPSYHR